MTFVLSSSPIRRPCFISIIGLLLGLLSKTSQAFVAPKTAAQRLVTTDGQSRTANTVNHSRSPTRLYKLEKLQKKQVTDKEVEELQRNYGEKSRLYRRDMYDAKDWVRARRPDRFLDNLRSFFDSGVVRSAGLEIGILASLSTFVCFYNNLFVEGMEGLGGKQYEPLLHLPGLQLPPIPFTISTTALGLLLTFRTNVSYARWNEARTAWGKVINDSRSIVRMGSIWAKSYNDINDQQLKQLAESVCSFSRALMNRLLSKQEDKKKFQQYTYLHISDPKYGEMLREAKHKPTAALAQITQTLVEFQLNPIHQTEIEQVVNGLCDALGACERIFTSPVPVFYTRFTARFLAVWLFALPLGLYAPFGSTWNHLPMIPVTVVLGLFLLGIERLATEMEEPFSILPMEKMCENSIRGPIMEQLERTSASPYQPEMVVPLQTTQYVPPIFEDDDDEYQEMQRVDETSNQWATDYETMSIQGQEEDSPEKLQQQVYESISSPPKSFLPGGGAPYRQGYSSGMPSYFDTFETPNYGLNEISGNDSWGSQAQCSPPSSYMPSSSRAYRTGGTGMSSYLDNFESNASYQEQPKPQTPAPESFPPQEDVHNDAWYLDNGGRTTLSVDNMHRLWSNMISDDD